MKNIFKVNIFFYLFLIIFIVSGYINYLIIFLVIMFFHEIGHIITIKLLGYKINKMIIYPTGGIIKTNISINIPSIHLFLISVSGVAMQLLLFLLVPESGVNNYQIFYLLNKSLIIFNLIPIIPLDGFKIYLSIVENIFSYRISVKIMFIISFISLFILFYYTKSIIVLLFLYIANINFFLNYQYYMNKFLLERYLYKISFKKRKYVDNINSIFKSRYNYIKYDNIYLEEGDVLKNIFQSFY